ncbi:nucleotide exchange factor GrpE [Salimicrobium humidisoli]|uniref:Protein GrpE n=1 Tax=Salimicrobium humidisoli TaxID=2029857 RepID=A0ABX4HUR9_9BACI|nr:nucleotide exchange factor GrpE [Salimicrobium humidisoli]PBB06843.1 nucleotide exchange factor GrpE [Salimicrobium humidisoli]
MVEEEKDTNTVMNESEGTEENPEDIVSEYTEEQTELEKVEQERDEIQERMLRVQADFDNFRRRTQKEKEMDRKYRSQSLTEELIPVLDNFERALQTEVKEESAQGFVDGMKMVYNQLWSALEKEGVEVISAQGETFDPHVHQAMMQVEEEGYESNVVVDVLQTGYKLNDRVIRPAMVKVNQ